MPLPIAIASAKMATADGRMRAKIELITAATMIRAVSLMTIAINAAMIAELPRQRLRVLPIDLDRVTRALMGSYCRSGS